MIYYFSNGLINQIGYIHFKRLAAIRNILMQNFHFQRWKCIDNKIPPTVIKINIALQSIIISRLCCMMNFESRTSNKHRTINRCNEWMDGYIFSQWRREPTESIFGLVTFYFWNRELTQRIGQKRFGRNNGTRQSNFVYSRVEQWMIRNAFLANWKPTDKNYGYSICSHTCMIRVQCTRTRPIYI